MKRSETTHFASGERRFDERCQMFAAGGEHQHGFGFQVHRLVQQQFAQASRRGRAAGFASLDDVDAAGFDKRRRQPRSGCSCQRRRCLKR